MQSTWPAQLFLLTTEVILAVVALLSLSLLARPPPLARRSSQTAGLRRSMISTGLNPGPASS
jgi:hypothetical protein